MRLSNSFIRYKRNDHLTVVISFMAELIYNETGKTVRFVMGPVEIRGKDGRVRRANGVYYGDSITVRLDHPRLTMEQLADHEAYHAKVDIFGQRLNREIREYILQHFTEEEFGRVVDVYLEKLVGVYGGENLSTEQMEALKQKVLEEILADAYAGINMFGVNASRFTEAVNARMDELHLGKQTQENGTEQPTGPPSAQIENTAENGGERYSIVEPFVDNNGVQYDSAVLLDTEFFSGLSPRNWGGRLRDFVKFRSSTEPFILPVQDENGVTQQLEFAKTTDRVYKTGKSQHDVLDELSMTSDNISKLAVVHIDEIVDISDEDIPYYTGQDPQNNHGWLDRNGWLHRTAHVINAKNGTVYKLAVDIAKAEDGRHILYATKGKINRVGTVQVNSLSIRGSGHNSNSAGTLSQIDPTVKRKDLEYAYYVSRKETGRARKLLDEAAAESGYSRESNWRLYHSAPNSQTGVSIADADQMYGGDGSLYGPMAQRYYGEGYAYDRKAIAAFVKVRNNPDAIITVYRAVPNTVQVSKLQNGDWVTPILEYAQNHGEMQFDGDHRIISQEVPAKDLYTNGDSIYEYGYDNGNENEVYKNTPNNVKTLDVTYDDTGKLIPLSKRFDDAVADERYSVDDEVDAATETGEEGKAKTSYDTLPTKARYYVRGAERKLLDGMSQALSVPFAARRDFLAPMVRAITNEYLQNGAVPAELVEGLFQRAYAEGIVVDEEFYNQYRLGVFLIN